MTTEFGHLRIDLMAYPEEETPEQVRERFGYTQGFVGSVKNIQQDADYFWGWCRVVLRVTTRHGVGEATLRYVSCLGAEHFAEEDSFNNLLQEALNNVKAIVS